ncbi:MAG TPA: TAT-variant-translocated molybdopterin oxidoreductase, partial [Thermoanaerobaculia bacterium]|nr:TAT-variant-translocated molybdopterin oxidoreductase [Thermoanaerobaculia bacterium]
MKGGLPTLPTRAAGTTQPDPLDFLALARRKADARGGQPWRSLEELADAPEFEAMIHREFPEKTVEGVGVDRRELFQFLGASFALAGLTACTRQPKESIVPYVRQPEELVPGRPLYFATAATLGGYATGLLIESHEGRPTKAEGNPLHPGSLGATDAFAQASLYALYDPDRSKTLLYLEEIRPWPAFLGSLRLALEAERAGKGAGLRILTETVTSPTMVAQIQAILRAFPDARWVQWEPVGRDNARAGAVLAFGEPVEPLYRFDRADVVLSLDADFLACGPGGVRFARDFASRRVVSGPETTPNLNRLWCVESTPGNTGARADHRIPLRAGDVEEFARRVAAALGAGSPAAAGNPADAPGPGVPPDFFSALVADLKAHRGTSLVLAGEHQPAEVHAIAHAINAALGNPGSTVEYAAPAEAAPGGQLDALRALTAEMDSGKVRLLVILSGNPAFTAPADLKFAERLQKVPLRAHLSAAVDETSALCQWHIPEAHFLEIWSDARALDGTASIVQPLIAPLYGGKSAHEVLAALSDQPERSAYDIVRETWRPVLGADFETAWRRALHDGVIGNTASPARRVAARGILPPRASSPVSAAPGALELNFRPDPTIHDGRFANNGWLQELPKPITKLTWDNAAILSVATAARLGLFKEDVVRLTLAGRSVLAPVWIEPGHPDDSVTAFFGYGRTRAGRFGSGAGFNAYALRSSDAPWIARGVEIAKTGATHPLACTQMHQNMEGRDLARAATAEEYRRDPGFVHRLTQAPKPEESLYADYPSDTYAWGMGIDLNQCVGCNACVVACQAENNIPVVGKDQVRRGREMHWLRIDHYYGGEVANPQHFFQPVPCMHCEKAPCELVCPVAATVHSAEGLNDMIYNRCVGTRYCSNNCPYKVRRFNFYHFSTQFRAPSMKMLANPDVTVRWRGVMEKCTYCVQRINGAKIDSEIAGRRVRDGDITTACAQACPANAI